MISLPFPESALISCCNFQSPPPQKLRKEQSRYKTHPEKSIGLKKLNVCFAELGIPYHIRAQQRGKEHKTQWMLEQ